MISNISLFKQNDSYMEFDITTNFALYSET